MRAVSPTDCTPQQFQCRRSGLCIDLRYKCDQRNDCDDASDEHDCGKIHHQCQHYLPTAAAAVALVPLFSSPFLLFVCLLAGQCCYYRPPFLYKVDCKKLDYWPLFVEKMPDISQDSVPSCQRCSRKFNITVILFIHTRAKKLENQLAFGKVKNICTFVLTLCD